MEITLPAAAMSLIPVIMALTSASKTYLDSKWSPLISLGLALLASLFLVPTADLTTTVIQGIFMGLTASGLYAGGKTTYGAVTKKA